MSEMKLMTLAAQQYYDEKIKAHIADEDAKLREQIETHVHSWNDLEDKPFGEELKNISATIANHQELTLDKKYVTDKLCAVINVTSTQYHSVGLPTAQYLVIFDGESYILNNLDVQAINNTPADLLGNPYLGNGELKNGINYEDNGLPFLILWAAGGRPCALYAADSTVSHTLEIHVIESQTKTIDEKFIPSTIARVSDLENIDLTPYETKTDAAAKLEEAKAYADGKDAAIQAVQNDVDALEAYVGTIPETATATDVIGYIQEKTSGIATDAALEELTGRVAQAETDIENIEKDYLKAADKTELQDNIDVVAGKVTTLIGEDANKSVRTIANEELAKQLVAEGAKESLDTLAEIAAWIQKHPDDASAMNKAIGDLEALVGAMPDGVAATTIVGYIQEAVAAEKSRAEGVEAGLDGRLADVEGAVATVDTRIATAKQEAIDAAAGDATSKANAAEAAAKSHADGLNTAMNTRVEALEAIDHDHANKAELDKIADGDVAKWNAAQANAEATAAGALSAAKTELEGKISNGDKANKDLIDGHETRIGALEAKVGDGFAEITNAEIDLMFA